MCVSASLGRCAEPYTADQAHRTLHFDGSATLQKQHAPLCGVFQTVAQHTTLPTPFCQGQMQGCMSMIQYALHVVCSDMQKTFSIEARKKGQQQQQQPSSSKHKKARAANVVSSTALTPGTPFMHDVCVSCSYYICARLATRKWQQVRSTYIYIGRLSVVAAAMDGRRQQW
jgi:hypothetical protein